MELPAQTIDFLGMEGNIGAIYTTLWKVDGDFVRMRRIGTRDSVLKASLQKAASKRVTFVLVHGIGLSSTYMLPLAEELSELGRVILFDLPGFGNLPLSQKPQHIPRLATILNSILSLTSADNVILVGHSMGAQIVTEMMAQNHNFRRACLIGPPVNIKERSFGWVLARYLQSAIFEKADLVRVATLLYLRSVKTWLVRLLPQMLDYPIEQRIQDVHPHSLIAVLSGTRDYLAPQYWLNELADRAAGEAWTGRISNAAHSTIYSHDEQVAQAIERLMTSTESDAQEDFTAAESPAKHSKWSTH
ncbi:alpha/beta fold hydrolase [Arcanobacterium hippocoleae]|uniref:alpha/beta fold hydrolase n=1 Tax=Arcanobacterium hippocoleae TaxID=149017 RepID=UPI0033416CB5